ncbi:uncharacterized protein [Triticum aestivum]|nr:uncharacterized protein LOC123108750 isoform X2 [Triticum aestivum]
MTRISAPQRTPSQVRSNDRNIGSTEDAITDLACLIVTSSLPCPSFRLEAYQTLLGSRFRTNKARCTNLTVYEDDDHNKVMLSSDSDHIATGYHAKQIAWKQRNRRIASTRRSFAAPVPPSAPRCAPVASHTPIALRRRRSSRAAAAAWTAGPTPPPSRRLDDRAAAAAWTASTTPPPPPGQQGRRRRLPVAWTAGPPPPPSRRLDGRADAFPPAGRRGRRRLGRCLPEGVRTDARRSPLDANILIPVILRRCQRIMIVPSLRTLQTIPHQGKIIMRMRLCML